MICPRCRNTMTICTKMHADGTPCMVMAVCLCGVEVWLGEYPH